MKNMKRFLALCLAVISLFAFAACGEKDDANVTPENNSDLAYVKDKGELIVGITYFAPMNYEKDGELIGFETEFAKAVGAKLGVDVKFQEIDWDNKEIELSGKTIDCIWNGMTITPERAENMSISTPYMKNKQVMVSKADFDGKIEGATVVAEAGSAGEELANTNDFFAKANFTPVDAMATALMEVAAGTADVAIVDYVTSIGSIGEGTDYEDLVVVESEDFNPEEYGIAFRKGSDVTVEVNKAIAELMADGTMDEIAAKYKLQDLLIK